MKKANKIILFLLCFSLLFCGSGITLLALSETSVTNNFSTGVVDIELEEFEIQNGEEIPYINNKEVLPGTEISKIPRVENMGNDCYIRVKLTFKDITELDDSNLFGITEDWVKIGEYYYYKNILKTHDKVDVFQGLSIPEGFSELNAGQKFELTIDVDAIQSKNFTPDFNSSEPWGSVEILLCEKEGTYNVSSFKQSDNQKLEIVYEGDTSKLVTNKEDFFTNFPVMLPGDTYNESIQIVNTDNRDINLYFRTEILEDEDILNKIQLKITTTIDGETKTVYEGSLNSNLDNQLLGIIKKNGSDTFDFSITVPPELNNNYSLLEGKIKWIFSTELIEEPKNPNNPENSSNSNNPQNPQKPTTPSKPEGSKGSEVTNTSNSSTTPNEITDGTASKVKTADTQKIGLFLIGIGISMFGVVLYLKKRENE